MAHLAAYTIEARGLVLGADTVYTTGTVRGLEGFSVRSGDLTGSGDGDLPGDNPLEPRIIDLEFSVYRSQMGTVEEMGAAVDAFAAAFVRSHTHWALSWSLPWQTERRVWVRTQSLIRPLSHEAIQSRASLAVQLKANDPRIYSVGTDSEWDQAVILSPYNVTPTALDYPVEYPKDWPDPAVIGGVERVAHNAGNDDAYPTLTVTKDAAGQSTGITLRNMTTNETFVYTGTIDPGQTLVVDFAAAVPIGTPRDPVLLSGSSRYGFWTLPRTPMRLVPGDNIYRLEGVGSVAGLLGALTWQNTSSS